MPGQGDPLFTVTGAGKVLELGVGMVADEGMVFAGVDPEQTSAGHIHDAAG